MRITEINLCIFQHTTRYVLFLGAPESDSNYCLLVDLHQRISRISRYTYAITRFLKMEQAVTIHTLSDATKLQNRKAKILLKVVFRKLGIKYHKPLTLATSTGLNWNWNILYMLAMCACPCVCTFPFYFLSMLVITLLMKLLFKHVIFSFMFRKGNCFKYHRICKF